MKINTARLKENIKKALKRKMAQGQSTKFKTPDGAKWFNPQEPGTYYIDIIPYIVSIDDHPDGIPKGEAYWYMPYKQHTGIGAEEKTFVCPTTFGKKCKICEYRASLMSNYEENKDQIDALKARDRTLLQIIDVKDRAAGIQLWDISHYLFVRQLEIELKEAEDESVYLFADPTQGYTLKVRFIEEKLGNNSFLRADRIDFIPRKKQYPESIIEEGYQLDQIIRRIDGDLLYDIFMDKVSYQALFEALEDDEDQEDTKGKTPKAPKSSKKKPEPETEPEAEEEDINDEEIVSEPEEEEETPKPTPRRRRREKKAEDTPKCPFGHVFGKDCDKFDDCDECPDDIWEKCSELSGS